MHLPFAPFSGPGTSCRTVFSVAFNTTMYGFEFSVRTGVSAAQSGRLQGTTAHFWVLVSVGQFPIFKNGVETSAETCPCSKLSRRQLDGCEQEYPAFLKRLDAHSGGADPQPPVRQ
jgi:hypothetical protein